MIEHYQPNLQIRDLSQGAVEETVDLVGYVYTDPGNVPGSGVADVEVALSDGQTARTDGQGLCSVRARRALRGGA